MQGTMLYGPRDVRLEERLEEVISKHGTRSIIL